MAQRRIATSPFGRDWPLLQHASAVKVIRWASVEAVWFHKQGRAMRDGRRPAVPPPSAPLTGFGPLRSSQVLVAASKLGFGFQRPIWSLNDRACS
jgi:hypothetical protein